MYDSPQSSRAEKEGGSGSSLTSKNSGRPQSAIIRTSQLSSRSQQNVIGQPITQQQHQIQAINSHQVDTIKQLFNRPTEAIMQKLNQRRIGLTFEANKDSSDNLNTLRRQETSQQKQEAKDYSIEISKKSIQPSLEVPQLQLILEKQPQQRSMKELNFVKECLCSLEIFKSWHDSQLLSSSTHSTIEQQCEDEYQNLLIYKYLTYKSYSQFEPLFIQGDDPKECYTIIKGDVLVLQKESSKKEKISQNQINQLLHSLNLSQEEYDKVNQLYPHHGITSRIKSGRLFGEIGLYFKEARPMTAICITDALEVGCLDYKSFKMTLQAQVTRQKEKILELLKQVSLFRGLQDNQFILLAKNCDIIHRNINSIIYKENDPVDYVYFIMNGEIEIVHSVKLKRQQRCQSAIKQEKSLDNSSRSLDRSNIQSQPYNLEQDDYYEDEGEIIADVKESIMLNKFYKPQSSQGGNKSTAKSGGFHDNYIKQLQQLAEQKQYNFMNQKKNNQTNISTIMGAFEMFGEQIENCEKRMNTAKVISSSIKLVRIKSSVFFDLIVNVFTKIYPQLDLIRALQLKNQRFEKHKESNLIPRKQILEMIEKQSKMEKQIQQYQQYEAEVSTTSLQTVLENIKHQKNEEAIRSSSKQNQQMMTPKREQSPLSQQNVSNALSTPSSQKYFRTRVISSNHSNQDFDSVPNTPSPTLTPGYVSKKTLFSAGESQFSQQLKRNQNTSNEAAALTTTNSNSKLNSSRAGLKEEPQKNSFTPININNTANTIRGQTSIPGQRSSLSSFSSAFFAAQSSTTTHNNFFPGGNSTNTNQQQQATAAKTNNAINDVNMSHNVSTPTSTQFNSTLILSTPKSSTAISRRQSRSTYYNSKFNFVKDSCQKFPEFSLLKEKSPKLDIQNSPKADQVLLRQQTNMNKSFNEEQGTQQIQQISDTNPLSTHTRSQSNPHGSISINEPHSARQNNNTNLFLSKKNSIFDILYPNIVTQVNRQIGVMKTNQQSIQADPKNVIMRKPSVNTLQHLQFRSGQSNSNPVSPHYKKVKLQLNRTTKSILTPRKVEGNEEKQKSLEQISQQQLQQNQQQSQSQPQLDKGQQAFSSQMCITYKHLKLDKMFPQSQHSVQTKQYFQDTTNEFKAKIDFDKKKLKTKAQQQQSPYMDYIGQKINSCINEMNAEQFNFLSKNS